MKAPGKGLLQVCGILLIILAAISLISCVISIPVYNTWDTQAIEFHQMMEQTGVTKSNLLVSIVLGIVQSIIYLLAGILGVKNCNRPEKAQINLILGSVILVFILANAVYSTVLGQLKIWSIIVSIIVPLLYVWGALKNKQIDGQSE